MKKGLKWKIVGSRLRWSVQIQRMNEKKLKKRACKQEDGGRCKKRKTITKVVG